MANRAIDIALLREGEVVPVGVPFDSLSVTILDEDGTPLGPGDLGEIAAAGRFIALGYWNHSDLMAEEFRTDPLVPGHRQYFSGDVGCLRPDGLLELHGRKDHYVKIRGNGLLIPTVEAAIRRQPGVLEAVVLPFRNPGGTIRLVGYVTLEDGQHPTSLDLRRGVGAQVPNFMVPWKVVELPGFPMTAGGKVARRDLPPPAPAREAWMPDWVAPLTGAEAEVAGLWREVLQCDRIGRDDDFFEMGGDSLDLAGIAAGFGQLGGVNVDEADLYADSTLKGMAAELVSAVRQTGR